MLSWDQKVLELARMNGLTFAENMRYMDDLRVWLFGVSLGWRWINEGVYYCSDWKREEQEAGMTGLQKTVEIFQSMMNQACNFLTMTMDTADDFNGVLPTLDLELWVRVREDNKTMYSFYGKQMSSNMVIQRSNSMPENMLVASLNQEVTRRMMNASEMLCMDIRPPPPA